MSIKTLKQFVAQLKVGDYIVLLNITKGLQLLCKGTLIQIKSIYTANRQKDYICINAELKSHLHFYDGENWEVRKATESEIDYIRMTQ